MEYIERGTRLVVPEASLAGDPPPTSPVFFNPAASLNRDVSVAVTAATDGSTFCDSMSGVGARGVRVAREVRRVESVELVDFNPDALKLGQRSAALNRVSGKCSFSNSETSSYLYSRYGRDRRFGYVDVDPFGTPVRQVQGALVATANGGVLSVTATDTAVLCGIYPEVCLRRYGAQPLNNSFHHETGLRILAASVATQGAYLDIGVEPVLAHATRHYARLFVRIKAGAEKADATLGQLGYISACHHCGHLGAGRSAEGTCPECARKTKSAGPLWLGGLVSDEVARSSGYEGAKRGLSSAERLLKSLEGVNGFPPWSFDLEGVCSELGIPSVPEDKVREELESAGYRTSRQPFETRGLKTNAGHSAVVDAVKEARRRVRGAPLARRARAAG